MNSAVSCYFGSYSSPCTVGLTSPILRAHAGLHACEMKNLSCRALSACGAVKFKLSCTVYILATSRLTVVSHEAKKKQHAHASFGLRNHYSELFTWMTALKFENAVTQRP